MQKLTQITAAGLLTIAMSSAMAADSMNGTTLSEKGMTLAVNGTASNTVPNDEAQMNWSVSAQAKTLKEATAEAIKTMNSGLSQIKAVSDQLKLQTQSMNSYPVYGETKGNQTPKIVAWRVSQSLEVIALDIDLVPKVIESVNGTLALDGLNFRVSDEAKAKYDESLYKMAVSDATQRSVWIAQSVGSDASKVQLQSLRFSGAASPRPVNMLMRASAKSMMDEAMPVPDIEAGTSELNLTVTAEVLIKR